MSDDENIVIDRWERAIEAQLKGAHAVEELAKSIEELALEQRALITKVMEIHEAKPTALDKLLSWSRTKPGLVAIGTMALVALTAFGVDLKTVIAAFVAGVAP